jgi:hypothetical protein
MLPRLFIHPRLWVGLALAGLASACGSAPKPVSAPLSGSDDQAASTYQYDANAEARLDQSALFNDATPAGSSILTVYFEGGQQGNCARWDVRFKGEDLKIAAGGRLDPAWQKLLVKDGADVVAKFQTRGGMPGLRLVAPAGAKLRLSGTQDYCASKDATDFDVKLEVKPTTKRKDSFKGVDVAGQGVVRFTVSEVRAAADAKTAELLGRLSVPA